MTGQSSHFHASDRTGDCPECGIHVFGERCQMCGAIVESEERDES